MSVWDELKHGRTIHGPPLAAQDPDCFAPAYTWMSRQMRYLDDAPADDVCGPMWAWPKKVDLRQRMFRAWSKDQRLVLLRLSVDNSRVLLSDYDAWHYVLNYWYLGSESASERFDSRCARLAGTSVYKTKPLPHARLDSLVRRSWQRIFDPVGLSRRLQDTHETVMQATLWSIRPQDVQGALEFGMGRPRQMLFGNC